MSESIAHLLYLAFAVGGAGLYVIMPKSDRSHGLAGAMIGLLAVAGLLSVLGFRVVAEGAHAAYFYLFAAITIVAASRVVSHPKPVYAALYFVLVVVATAAMLVLLSAEFLAVALIIIYAGAILVTYLFVIMLAQQSGSPVYDRRSREPFAGILMGFLLMAAVAGRSGDLPTRVTPTTTLTQSEANAESQEKSTVATGNSYAVGVLVMTRHVVALETSGILLLVSMVGAISLSRKKVTVEGFTAAALPLGRIGKEVPPF